MPAARNAPLAWDLCRNEVPYFLPMVMREIYSGGQRRRNLHPMFKSYLFFAGGEEERLAVLKTNRLVQLVPICPAEQPSFRIEPAGEVPAPTTTQIEYHVGGGKFIATTRF